MILNPDKISEIIIETADEFIVPRYKALKEHEISSKSNPNDLVTQADIEAEAHLERILPDMFSGSLVIGEEGLSRGDHDIAVLCDDSQAVWVVDPVDGTRNFVNGKREFGVMLSLNINGKCEYSWIYDILGREMAVAERESGAYLNGARMNIGTHTLTPISPTSAPTSTSTSAAMPTSTHTPSLELAELSGYVSPQFFPESLRDGIRAAGKQVKSYKPLGCSAHEYLNTAKGLADFVVTSKINPWDHMSGTLLVEEAGGVVMTWSREPYLDYSHRIGLITACNSDVWNKAFNLFIKDII